ncbi:MAG: DNA-binding protein [delta proteobacterium ML8_F1]|nr:MAG: DNA-binding protein [delta proteobacterium ML8_F1]
MDTYIRTGKNVNEVVELALIELDKQRDEIEIEVLEEDSKGILGIFGTKEAKVKITVKENAHLKAREFLEGLLEKMGIKAAVEATLEEGILNLDVSGENMALLIGKRGQTLDSLQYLVSIVVNRGREDYLRVILDTEDYRNKRRKTLERLAQKMAEKSRKLRKDIILEPMNPYERRIIHSTLQGNPHVETKSDGADPNRRVIIFFKR